MSIDLGVLDTVISVVVVILLLSMAVQSIQTFIKKLSTFKSRQIRKSLEQLFSEVTNTAPATGAANAKLVLDRFRDLGRNNTFGRHAIDSIAKEDLLKVVASIEKETSPEAMQARLQSIASWYDTVMLGFEERYARHMQTWAFVISLAVTIFLNADVLQVYKRLATDEVARQRVLNESTAVQQRYLGRIEQARATNDDATLQQLTTELNQELDEVTLSYPALGLTPLDYSNFNDWTVAGWLLMAFLLSFGAPFWHDTLQSLFGLKNFLRQKSDTRKVEQLSGQGLTAP